MRNAYLISVLISLGQQLPGCCSLFLEEKNRIHKGCERSVGGKVKFHCFLLSVHNLLALFLLSCCWLPSARQFNI